MLSTLLCSTSIARDPYFFPWSIISHKYSSLAVITEGVRSDVATFSLTPGGWELQSTWLDHKLLEKDREGASRLKFGTPILRSRCFWGSILGCTCSSHPRGRKIVQEGNVTPKSQNLHFRSRLGWLFEFKKNPLFSFYGGLALNMFFA